QLAPTAASEGNEARTCREKARQSSTHDRSRNRRGGSGERGSDDRTRLKLGGNGERPRRRIKSRESQNSATVDYQGIGSAELSSGFRIDQQGEAARTCEEVKPDPLSGHQEVHRGILLDHRDGGRPRRAEGGRKTPGIRSIVDKRTVGRVVNKRDGVV